MMTMFNGPQNKGVNVYVRLECGCTAEQEEMSDIEHSDCMQRVKPTTHATHDLVW